LQTRNEQTGSNKG